MKSIVFAGVVALAFSVLHPATAVAQVSMPPEFAAVGECLCLSQALDLLRGDMDGKRQRLAEARAELDRVSQDLEAARSRIDVNNPEVVARFRQMVERRDTLFKRVNGPATSEVTVSTDHFNDRANAYNMRCTNRPMDPAIVARVQPTLVCPRP